MAKEKTICCGFRTSMKLIPRAINGSFRSEIKQKHNVRHILHWLIPQTPSSTAHHFIRDKLHDISPAMAVLLPGSVGSAHSDSLFLLFTPQLLTPGAFHTCLQCILIISPPPFLFLPPSRTTAYYPLPNSCPFVFFF